MIVLDTNVVSAMMRSPVDAQLQQWATQVQESFLVTSVSIVEIQYGIERLPVGRRRTYLEKQFEKMRDPSSRIAICELDEQAALKAGRFLAAREAQGRPVEDADMMIAGIAAELGASIATRNVRDFEGLGLTVVDPWAP